MSGMRTISGLLSDNAARWGERPYIFVKRGGGFEGISFSRLAEDTGRFAAAIEVQGLSGGNIMLFSKNSYEWIVIALAVIGYTGTLVPIDCEWTAFDLEHAMTAVAADAIFYERDKACIAESIREKFPNVRLYCIEECFDRLVSEKLPVPQGITDRGRRSMIFFTSGTTNMPKAIPLTQANLLNNWDATCARTPIDDRDSIYIFLPFSHVYGWISNLLHSMIAGAATYLCSDISRMLEELIEVRPTVFCTVPLILGRLRAAASGQVMNMLRGIRYLYCGGSFLDPEIKRFFIERGVSLYEAYGATETSSIISLSLKNDEKADSVGVVMDGLDVRIIDPDESGAGEIIVGGGSVSSGYLYHSDSYSDFDADGFYHTGDIGRLDETGHLFLLGRKRRVIITGNGRNVYPDELEALLTQRPEVISAAVFEKEHHIAARVTTNASEDEIDGIISGINEKLPRFKQIRSVQIKRSGGGIK